MLRRDVVKEGSSAKLRVDFFDESGAPAAPSAVSVRIECLTTGTEIRAETSVTPAQSVTVDITPTENRIIDPARSTERRRVTVRSQYGAGEALNEQYDYVVQNLSGV